MKKALLAVGFFLYFAPVISAQNWAEERNYLANGEATPRLNGLFTKNFGKKVGGFVWFQVAQSYSQAYGGVTYAPLPWIQFAIGIGLEQAKNPARAGGYVWIDGHKSTLLLIGEYGGSGLWGKFEYNYKLNKVIGLGAISERFKGTGSRIQISIPRTPITIWGSPMIYKGEPVGLVGLRVNF